VGVNPYLAYERVVEAAKGIEGLIGCFAFQNHTGGGTIRRITVKLQQPCGGLKSSGLSKEPGLQAFDRGAERLANPAGLRMSD
jgi:hypothetical protein